MALAHWIKSYLNDDSFQKIEKKIKEAESKTSGELVPVIVRKSSTVGHVPVILLFLFALLFFVFDGDYWQMEFFDLPHWLLIVIDFLILAILVRLLSPLPFVERLLTSKIDQRMQVEQRAINEFHQLNIKDTKDSTGILIFVSLMEHQAVVLGDEAIAKKLRPETWQEVVDRLIQGIKEKDMAKGFCEAIDMSGELLSEHFPIQPDDTNELKNHLVIKE